MDEPTRSVQEAPAQCLGSCLDPGTVEAEQLEPAHQVGRHGDGHHPVGVGLEVGEGEAQEPRVLETLNVLFDVGVGPHGGVEVDGVTLAVGVEAPVAIVEGGEQASLGSRVQRFATDDAAGAFGQLVVRDERGHLADRSPFSGLAVLAQRLLPDAVEAGGRQDGPGDLGVRSHRDVEADVALPAGTEKALGAPRRVGPHDDLSLDNGRVVAGSVAERDLAGQLVDGAIEDIDVVGHCVGSGVARTKHTGERLAGGIGEAEHGVEAIAALEGGRSRHLVFGVDLDQRGVDVQEHRGAPRRRSAAAPDLRAHLGHGTGDLVPGLRRDLVERAKDGGVRGHRAEEVLLESQVLDVRAALAATGEHQRRVHQDLAPVVQREAFAGWRDARRERIAEPDPVGKSPKSVQPDMGHHASATGFHNDATRAGTVHLGSALLVGISVA